MNFRIALTVLWLTGPLLAQYDDGNATIKATGYRIYEDRVSTRMLYRYRATDESLGQAAISYGQPEWKSEYENSGVFDQLTRGRMWRMGKDFWTVLDTSLSLEIGGRPVIPGDYYLGLYRTQDGSIWNLVVIDADEARKRRLDAARIEQAPVKYQIPLTHSRANDAVPRLEILLTRPGEEVTQCQLTITWGPHRLSVPVKVALDQ